MALSTHVPGDISSETNEKIKRNSKIEEDEKREDKEEVDFWKETLTPKYRDKIEKSQNLQQLPIISPSRRPISLFSKLLKFLAISLSLLFSYL